MDTRATARSLSDGRATVGAAHAALGRGAPARPWIACGAACDAVDLTLTLLDRLPRGAAGLSRTRPLPDDRRNA